MEETDRTALLDADAVESQSVIETDSVETLNTQNVDTTSSQIVTRQSEVLFVWKMVSATANTLALTLIGATGVVTLWFAFKKVPIGAFQLHVGLSVTGYQLLMAHGVLCLRTGAWTNLSYRHRRRIHWILQLSGSALAIAGSAIMIRLQEIAGKSHFTSAHGKLAIAALVFANISLINGALSLYAVELRRFIPPKLSKLSHIIFGSATFAVSSACLCTGLLKKSFVEWASLEFAYVLIGSVTMYTSIILLPPTYVVIKRLFIWNIR